LGYGERRPQGDPGTGPPAPPRPDGTAGGGRAGHGRRLRQDDRRERRWRVTEARPSIRLGPESDGIVKHRLELLVVERATRAILDYVDRGDQDPRSESAGITSAIVTLDPQEAAELKRKWRELLEPYLVTGRATGAESGGSEPRPDREHIRVFMALTPMAATERTDQAHQAESGDQRDD
jgi:hypothetical protein